MELPTPLALLGYVAVVSLLLVVVAGCARWVFSAWTARPQSIDDALEGIESAVDTIRTEYDARFRALEVEAENVKDKVQRTMNRVVARQRRGTAEEVEPEVANTALDEAKARATASAEPEAPTVMPGNQAYKTLLRAQFAKRKTGG